jgi:hypothetical protein
MKTTILTTLALLLGLSLLAPAARAADSKAQVVDGAGFFSADAVRQANARLADIDQKYGRQMRIETFAEIPADQRSGYTEPGKRAFFTRWARQRAQASGIRGAFVLICKNPSSLQVEVGDDTLRSGAFTEADRLSAAMLSAFRAKDYDKGLSDGIDIFENALRRYQQRQENPANPAAVSPRGGTSSDSGAAQTSPPVGSASSPPKPYSFPQAPSQSSPPPMSRSSGGVHFGGIVVFIIVLFVIVAIIRRVLRGAASSYSRPGGYGPSYGAPPPAGGYPPGYGYGGGGGGGGFGRGFGGGILGGMLGGWLGNQMSRRYDNSGYSPSTPPDNSGGNTGVFNEPPSSSSSFGSSGGESFSGGGGGGGDFGSSGSSGGDFGGGGGGGDSGGGGGSGGSSGGDF